MSDRRASITIKTLLASVEMIESLQSANRYEQPNPNGQWITDKAQLNKQPSSNLDPDETLRRLIDEGVYTEAIGFIDLEQVIVIQCTAFKWIVTNSAFAVLCRWFPSPAVSPDVVSHSIAKARCNGTMIVAVALSHGRPSPGPFWRTSLWSCQLPSRFKSVSMMTLVL